jgi:hypothetical protein
MKPFLPLALLLGLFAPLGLIGCGEEAKNETKTTTTSPGGTTTETHTDKVNKSGENPPPAPAEK